MTLPLMIELLAFVSSGLFAGMLSSLFGIGGGLIIVPTLYWLLQWQGMNPYFVMHLAVGTSLAVMIVAVFNSIHTHHQRGNVLWPVVKTMSPAIALGVVVGAGLSQYLHSDYLRYLFIAFLLYTIASALLKKQFTSQYVLADFKMPAPVKTTVVCIGTGVIGVLLGVGGSMITMPFLRKAKMPMKNAAACAAALTPVVAIVGAIGYIIAGWHIQNLPHYVLGFVYLPAFFGIALGSLGGVPIGAHLAHKLPDQLAAKIYIGILMLIVLGMLV